MDDKEQNKIGEYLIDAFRDAKEIGSLQTVERHEYKAFGAYLDAIGSQNAQLDIFSSGWLQSVKPTMEKLCKQAEILSNKYAVVCTNPPYMNKLDRHLKDFVVTYYKAYSGDLFSVFMYRNFGFCKENGYSAFMTPNVWMFIKTYENLRNYILNKKSIVSLIQMANGAFNKEATVNICTFILKNAKETEKGLYFRLEDFKGDMEVQKQKILEALADKNCGYFYETNKSNFATLPGSPVAYWISSKLICAYEGDSLSDYATITNGLFTCDNKRFLRLWHEVHVKNIRFQCESKKECLSSAQKWYPYNKGGNFRRWYGNQEYIVNFYEFGAEISQYRIQSGQSASFPGQDFYFHDSMSWSLVGSEKFGIRYYPTGFVFDIAGSSIFPNCENKLGYFLGFLASEVARSCLKLINPTVNFQAGDIRKLPLIYDEHNFEKTSKMSWENIALSRQDWDAYETSWDFKRNPLV